MEKRDKQCIASLSGDFVDFSITDEMEHIMIGRGPQADVDLSNQIGSGRIHRKHAMITIKVRIGVNLRQLFKDISLSKTNSY